MTKFIAIDPAGKTHTRTSKERIYTHMVVASPSATKAVLAAMSNEARRSHRSNFAYYTEAATGTSHFQNKRSWETEEMHAERKASQMAEAVKALQGCKTAEEYEKMRVERDLAAIQKSRAAGYYDTYICMGWCGRHDLAVKLKVTSENRGWLEVTILEATHK